jgi:hypothetical protein
MIEPDELLEKDKAYLKHIDCIEHFLLKQTKECCEHFKPAELINAIFQDINLDHVHDIVIRSLKFGLWSFSNAIKKAMQVSKKHPSIFSLLGNYKAVQEKERVKTRLRRQQLLQTLNAIIQTDINEQIVDDLMKTNINKE